MIESTEPEHDYPYFTDAGTATSGIRILKAGRVVGITELFDVAYGLYRNRKATHDPDFDWATPSDVVDILCPPHLFYTLAERGRVLMDSLIPETFQREVADHIFDIKPVIFRSDRIGIGLVGITNAPPGSLMLYQATDFIHGNGMSVAMNPGNHLIITDCR